MSTERRNARLLEMIREAGISVPEGTRFQQTYAGRNQRNEGCALWVLIDADGQSLRPHVCSRWPRAVLLARGVYAWRDVVGAWQIAPLTS
jgi:hypothetical protein